MKSGLFFIVTILLTCQLKYALCQEKSLEFFMPTRDQMMKRYKEADNLDSLVKKTVFRSSVQPGWSGSSSFWYKNILADSQYEYILVDPTKVTKSLLFDAHKMSKALSTLTSKTVTPGHLPIKDIYLYPNRTKIAIAIGEANYEVDLANYSFIKIDTLPSDKSPYPGLTKPMSRWQRVKLEKQSPDKKWTIILKENNIYILPAGGVEPIAYTTDGNADLPYGEITWSPDSRHLIAYKIRKIVDKPVYFIATSLPNTTRGEVKQQNYKQPGDDFSTYEMHIINLKNKKVTKVKTDIIDFFDAPVLRWNYGDKDHFMFERVDRGHQRFRIIEVNIEDGSTRNIVDEKTNTFIYEQKIFTHYLPATAEIVWVTEMDGGRHIYLVDSKKGVIKNQITQGPWVVRAIDSIDVIKREIWFQASGMNEGEDPYNIHYYRIGFNGKKLVKLTAKGYNHRLIYSPDKQYFIDTYSTVDQPPSSIVARTFDGKKLMDIETADISHYSAAGFKLPEVFHAKGRDIQTEIWGVIFRPTDFDASKKYPIIENIYAGPQDSFVPKLFSATCEMQSLAELGFIVVQIDGMGTANRSKAFHDVCWKNLGDAGFPDRIVWMRAMAQKYPQADTSRIGLYGTSAGGQNSLGGLLFHPDWYKVAVSACGCHDNRIDKQWWNEQWMGFPIGKHYDEQSNITNAYKLKGKLLLIVGEADQNVPPESTYRVADALIKARKTFDFLSIPGMGHGDGGPYGRMKKRDFFVKNLLGIDPPDRNNNELSSTVK